jgi:alpha-methylacyl-CoA racemase
MRSGPLAGLKFVEFASIGPGPHCAMLFADLGAEVLRIARPHGNGWPNPVVDRGRAILALDIRTADGRAAAIEACRHADVLIEGLRPGVMERLGLGPDDLFAINPRLVYGRMTGWGQEGPLAKVAGHDITYIALSGTLAAIGKPGEPAVPPLNLVGDFGGGSMFLAFGIVAALWERERSGKGQVVDAAIIDGVASLMTMFAGLLPSGVISLERDRNMLGGAAPFYRCYLCADGLEIAVGAIEPQFWAELVKRLGRPELTQNPADWPQTNAALTTEFAARPRQHWIDLFGDSDACVAPVLPFEAVAAHPHHAARGTYIEHEGLRQAAPAPRFSRTPGALTAMEDDADGRAMLERWSRSG